MSCQHENAMITLYEEKPTRYQLEGGVIGDIDDDIEAEPLFRADVSCPDCHQSMTYPDWTQAPEPLLTYCRSIFQQEYGSPFRNASGRMHAPEAGAVHSDHYQA